MLKPMAYISPEDICWDDLSSSFVVKCNHGSGYNIVVKDSSTLIIKEVEAKLRKWMPEDHWVQFVEPQYRFIEKKILIEEYLGDNIHTYRFYSFNGEPKVMYILSNGPRGLDDYDMYYDYFDMDYNWLNVTLGEHKRSNRMPPKPHHWEELKLVARQFVESFPFVRVDLYDIPVNTINEGDLSIRTRFSSSRWLYEPVA